MAEMERKYMVVAYGESKKDKRPYSRAYRLKEAREGGWGYLDQKDTYYSDEIRPLGEIITLSMQEV